MNDKDIAKLTKKLTTILATKEDVSGLGNRIGGLEGEIKTLRKELKADIQYLHEKADKILEFAENVDEVTENHEKRIIKLEKHLHLPSQPIAA